MKILIDTHVFLWSALDPAKLAKSTLSLLADEENEKFFSVASSWEIAIKYGKGLLMLPDHPRECVPGGLAAAGITSLPIRLQDVLAVADLPPYHKDPFDRLLIMQARNNQMHLLSSDPLFKKYDVNLIGQ